MAIKNSILLRISLILTTVLLLAGTGIVFFLSWLPNPELGKYGFLPGWLARWTDAEVNDELRTAVPQLFMGFLAGFWLYITKRGWRWWLNALLGLVSIVLIAEIGQLTLPYRIFDWGDVAWGSVGSLSGLAIAALGLRIIYFMIKQTRGLPQSSPERP